MNCACRTRFLPFLPPIISIRLLLVLLVLGGTAVVCLPQTARAEADLFDPIDPIDSRGSFYNPGNNVYFQFDYTNGDSYAQANQNLRFSGTHYTFLHNGALLLTGHGLLTDEGNAGAGVGLVRRWLRYSPVFGDHVIGTGFHWDMSQSDYEYTYHQVVGTVELLKEDWAVRFTGYGPVGTRVHRIERSVTVTPVFQANGLFANTIDYRLDEASLGGVEVELARSVGDLYEAIIGTEVDNDAAEAYLGYYNLQGPVGPEAHGIRGGVRGYLFPWMAANVTVSHDDVFGTSVYGGFTLFFGGSGGNLPTRLKDKLTIPVQRNYQVAVNRVETSVDTLTQFTYQGNPITLTHVNDDGVGTGDGTAETPFGSLTDAAGSTTDIVYVYADSVFDGQYYVMAPNQRLLGEGDGYEHLVQTDQLGQVALPRATAGTNRPLIRNVAAGHAGVTMAADTEVSAFSINGVAETAILASDFSGDVNVNRTKVTAAEVSTWVLRVDGDVNYTANEISHVRGGVLIQEVNSRTILFQGNTIQDVEDETVGLWQISGVGVTLLDVTGDVAFQENTISNTERWGVYFRNVFGDVEFIDNAVTHSDLYAIEARYCRGDFVFRNNTVTDSYQYSIFWFSNTGHLQFVGNTVGNAERYGAYLRQAWGDESLFDMRDNTFSGCGMAAVYAMTTGGYSATLDMNLVGNTADSDYVLENSGQGLFRFYNGGQVSGSVVNNGATEVFTPFE